VIVCIEEAGDDVLRRAAGFSAAERHENHLVSVKRTSIPTSVFAYEGAAAVACGKVGACVHRDTQWRHMRAQGVVRHNRLSHQIGALRLDPRVEMLAVIAIGPAIETAVLHGGQIIRNQIGPDLIAFVDDGPEFAGLRLPHEAVGLRVPLAKIR